jgi:hypothetical protein
MFLEDVYDLSRGSNKKVLVLCDFQESESCLGHVMRKYSDVLASMEKTMACMVVFRAL